MKRWLVTFSGHYGEKWQTVVEAENEIKAIVAAYEEFDTPEQYFRVTVYIRKVS